MTFDEMRAAEISRMGQNSARNPINMGWLPTSGDGQNQQALLDYLASIYGYNTQGNIAGYNGQVSLANTQLQNSGALDRANIGRDIAQFQDQGQSYRTGLSENAATQRSVFDNQGADYRAGLGMLANTYAPALQSDMRGYAMNNFASPLLQTLFGINPGTPYQTR